jgi:hypothetical protein
LKKNFNLMTPCCSQQGYRNIPSPLVGEGQGEGGKIRSRFDTLQLAAVIAIRAFQPGAVFEEIDSTPWRMDCQNRDDKNGAGGFDNPAAIKDNTAEFSMVFRFRRPRNATGESPSKSRLYFASARNM